MQIFGSGRRRFVSLLLAVLLIVTGVVPVAFAADDDDEPEYSYTHRSYQIAVVFDNSGSMYDTEAWCRAKYAMEIFASMLDYGKGDRLTVFPMWKVTTDGSTPPADRKKAELANAKDKIEISDKKDIDKISRLFTIYAEKTPFEPVVDAYEFLKNSDKDKERWLIVLTDGIFDKYGSAQAIQTELLKIATDQTINIQYLGIGEKALDLPAKPDKKLFAAKSNDVDLKDKLIDICNAIFQRNALPPDRLNGDSLHLDFSMRKLIVFAQGQNAKIGGLKSPDGKDVDVALDSEQRKFSEISAGYKGDEQPIPVDRTLAGQVVTFDLQDDELPGGDYTLDCTGADRVQVFYEPNVRIKTTLRNHDGAEVGENDTVYVGTYTLNNQIVDCITEEDVSDSELLGNNVMYDIKVNGRQVENDAQIELTENDDTKIRVTATYLDKYKLNNHDSRLFEGFKVVLPPKTGLEVKVDCKQKNSWYVTTVTTDWQPIRVDVRIDGAPLSDDRLAALDLSFDYPGVEFSAKQLPGESAYEISPGVNEAGELIKPEDGIYKFTATARMVDNFDREISASDSATTVFKWYSSAIIFLLVLLVLLAIAALILFFLSRKALPKHMKANLVFTMKGKDIHGSKFDYSKKGKTISAASPQTPMPQDRCTVKFTVYPVGKRWTPSRRRRFGISKITAASGVEEVQINGTVYVKNEHGIFAPATDPNATQIKFEGYNPMILVATHNSELTGTIKQF